jgi:hypothetical protein
MSIFKESFKKEIREQIDVRQNKVSSGDRTYFLRRQCVFRMASGVDIGGSNKIAKENVLEGGTKTVTTTTGEEGTIINNFSNKIGFNGAYDQPSDGFGYVPMPGITSINIKTKTAYGSLREVIVNFECHNKRQLDILEQLYMRPGYPCLVEWGWEPFLNNSGGTNYNLGFISNNNNFWIGEGGYDQDNIQEKIETKKLTYQGNYDALFGLVSDFNYSVRPDGGYSCTTTLIATGEVIASIRGVISEEDPTKHVLEKHLQDLNEYASSISKANPTENEYIESLQAKGETLEENRSYRNRILGPDTKSDFEEEFKKIREEKFQDLGDYYFLSKKEGGLGLIQGVDIIEQNSNLEIDIKPSVYIKWGAFINFINDSINQDDNGKKIATIEAPDDIFFNNAELNSDVLEKVNGLNPYKDIEGGSFFINLNISINPQICLFPKNINDLNFNSNLKSTNRQIKNIYFNIKYLYKTFSELYFTVDSEGNSTPNEEFSLGNYINKLWDDVNTSCGNIHNFKLYNDFEKNKISYVIDLEFEKPPAEIKYTTLKVLGTESIVRDFKYDLSIPSSLISTIAIAAQNPDSAQDLNQVTFAAFNKGIKNRFSKSSKGNKSLSVSYKRKKLFKAYFIINEDPLMKTDEVRNVYGNTLFYTPIEGPKVSGTNGQETLWRLADLLIELQIYLERLKGGNRQLGSENIRLSREAGEGFTQTINIPTVINSPFLNTIKEYNETSYREFSWNFGGDAYDDFDSIPSVDISSATSILNKISTLNRDLQRYNLKDPNNKYPLKDIANPNISSIIPLKFSVKLDGIGNIVIGNVFKIQESKLPKLYKDNNVAFIVTGEEQQIDGQDWTTTITGQAVMLPI